jgi:hypothetical protein
MVLWHPTSAFGLLVTIVSYTVASVRSGFGYFLCPSMIHAYIDGGDILRITGYASGSSVYIDIS